MTDIYLHIGARMADYIAPVADRDRARDQRAAGRRIFFGAAREAALPARQPDAAVRRANGLCHPLAANNYGCVSI